MGGTSFFEVSFWFNDAVSVFLPKPIDDAAHDMLNRSPEDTRPLALKNTDNKILAAAFNSGLSSTTPTWADPDQRGFVPNRQGVDNIIGFDTAMRIQDWTAPAAEMPLGLCFDFKAAFPSISHSFLFLVLRAIGVPRGLERFLSAMYRQNDAYACVNGALQWLFSVQQGVLQGCPLSGTLFVFCVNIVLKMLRTAIGPKGSIKAFADDVAIVIGCIRRLRAVHAAFATFGKGTNLHLKPRKCVAVPLAARITHQRIAEVSSRIASVVPEWSDLLVAAAAKYLGVWVGPESVGRVWGDPLGKWWERGTDLASQLLAPSMAVREYNRRAVPTLGYVAQVCAPPVRLRSSEKRMVETLFHTMSNGFPPRMLFNLGRLGIQPPTSLNAFCRAAAFRTANRTSRDWKSCKEEFDRVRVDDPLLSPYSSSVKGATPWWDSEPMCDFLARASHAFPDEIGLDAAEQVVSAAPEGQQKLAYKSFRRLGVPFEWCSELARRLSLWTPEDFKIQIPGIKWDPILAGLKRAPPTLALSMLRLWCHAWSTAHRTHDSSGGWVCKACGGPDSLRHLFFECNVVWVRVAEVLGRANPSDNIFLERLALQEPFRPMKRDSTATRAMQASHAFRIHALFGAYHSLAKTCTPHGKAQWAEALQISARKAFLVL